MSIKTTSPGVAGTRPEQRTVLRWPSPDTLVWVLLIVIAMVVASLVGLSLGAL